MKPGRWLWQATRHRGKVYGFDYSAPDGLRCISLLENSDAISFRTLSPKSYCEGRPGETHLDFKGDTALALVRLGALVEDEVGRRNNGPVLSLSDPPYTSWNAPERGPWFGLMRGPSLVRTPYSWIIPFVAAGFGTVIVVAVAKRPKPTQNESRETDRKPAGINETYRKLLDQELKNW